MALELAPLSEPSNPTVAPETTPTRVITRTHLCNDLLGALPMGKRFSSSPVIVARGGVMVVGGELALECYRVGELASLEAMCAAMVDVPAPGGLYDVPLSGCGLFTPMHSIDLAQYVEELKLPVLELPARYHWEVRSVALSDDGSLLSVLATLCKAKRETKPAGAGAAAADDTESTLPEPTQLSRERRVGLLVFDMTSGELCGAEMLPGTAWDVFASPDGKLVFVGVTVSNATSARMWRVADSGLVPLTIAAPDSLKVEPFLNNPLGFSRAVWRNKRELAFIRLGGMILARIGDNDEVIFAPPGPLFHQSIAQVQQRDSQSFLVVDDARALLSVSWEDGSEAGRLPIPPRFTSSRGPLASLGGKEIFVRGVGGRVHAMYLNEGEAGAASSPHVTSSFLEVQPMTVRTLDGQAHLIVVALADGTLGVTHVSEQELEIPLDALKLKQRTTEVVFSLPTLPSQRGLPLPRIVSVGDDEVMVGVDVFHVDPEAPALEQLQHVRRVGPRSPSDVSFVAVASGGGLVAISSTSGVSLYSVTGEELAVVTNMQPAYVAFSHDGRRLCLLSDSMASAYVELYDVSPGGKTVQRLPTAVPEQRDIKKLMQVRFSPDGRFIFGCGQHIEFTVFDGATGDLVEPTPYHMETSRPGEYIHSIDCAGEFVALGGDEGSLYLVQAVPPFKQVLPVLDCPTSAVLLSPDGKLLFACSHSQVQVLLVPEMIPIGVLSFNATLTMGVMELRGKLLCMSQSRAHKRDLSRIMIRSEARYVRPELASGGVPVVDQGLSRSRSHASSGADEEEFSLSRLSTLPIVTGHREMAVSPDSRLLAGYTNGVLQIFDMVTLKPVCIIPCTTRSSIIFLNNTTLVTVSDSTSMAVQWFYSHEDQAVSKVRQLRVTGYFRTATAVGDDMFAVSTTEALHVFDLNSGQVIAELKTAAVKGARVVASSSPGNSRLFVYDSASGQHPISLYEIDRKAGTMTVVRQSSELGRSITSMVLHESGDEPFLGLLCDKQLVLLDLESLEVLRSINLIQDSDSYPCVFTISPDGKFAAVGFYSAEINVVSLSTEQVVQTLTGHASMILSAAFLAPMTPLSEANSTVKAAKSRSSSKCEQLRFVSCGYDGVILWSPTPPRQLGLWRKLDTHSSRFVGVALEAGLVVVASFTQVDVYLAQSGAKVQTIELLDSETVALAPSGAYMLIGAEVHLLHGADGGKPPRYVMHGLWHERVKDRASEAERMSRRDNDDASNADENAALERRLVCFALGADHTVLSACANGECKLTVLPESVVAHAAASLGDAGSDEGDDDDDGDDDDEAKQPDAEDEVGGAVLERFRYGEPASELSCSTMTVTGVPPQYQVVGIGAPKAAVRRASTGNDHVLYFLVTEQPAAYVVSVKASKLRKQSRWRKQSELEAMPWTKVERNSCLASSPNDSGALVALWPGRAQQDQAGPVPLAAVIQVFDAELQPQCLVRIDPSTDASVDVESMRFSHGACSMMLAVCTGTDTHVFHTGSGQELFKLPQQHDALGPLVQDGVAYELLLLGRQQVKRVSVGGGVSTSITEMRQLAVGYQSRIAASPQADGVLVADANGVTSVACPLFPTRPYDVSARFDNGTRTHYALALGSHVAVSKDAVVTPAGVTQLEATLCASVFYPLSHSHNAAVGLHPSKLQAVVVEGSKVFVYDLLTTGTGGDNASVADESVSADSVEVEDVREEDDDSAGAGGGGDESSRLQPEALVRQISPTLVRSHVFRPASAHDSAWRSDITFCADGSRCIVSVNNDMESYVLDASTWDVIGTTADSDFMYHRLVANEDASEFVAFRPYSQSAQTLSASLQPKETISLQDTVQNSAYVDRDKLMMLTASKLWFYDTTTGACEQVVEHGMPGGDSNNASIVQLQQDVVAVVGAKTVVWARTKQCPSAKQFWEFLQASPKPQAVRRMIESHPSLVAAVTLGEFESALHRAARARNAELAAMLLESPNSNVLQPSLADGSGPSPLALALRAKDSAMVRLLLKHVPKTPLNTRHCLVDMLPEMAAGYPLELTELFVALDLEEVPDSSLLTGCEFARMGNDEMLYVGRDVLFEERLWQRELADDELGMSKEDMEEAQQTVGQDETGEMDAKLAGVVPVKAVVVGIPGIAAHEPDESKNPLAVLVRHDLRDVVGSRLMRNVIEFKWQQFGRASFLPQMIAYMAFLLVFTVASLVGDQCPDYFDGSLGGVGQLALDGGTVLFALAYFVFELTQMRAEGVRLYLSSVYNVMDLLYLLAIFVVAPYRVLCLEQQGTFLAVTAVLMWFKTLEYARGFRSTGPFVRMIVAVTLGIGFFLLVLLVIMVGFGHAFVLVFRDRAASDEAASSDFADWNVLLALYRAMLGDFDTGEFGAVSEEQHWLAIALFVGFTLSVSIVLLNLLIALMSDIYTKVQENVETEWLMERAQIILSLESQLRKSRRTSEAFPMWIHCLRPLQHVDVDEARVNTADVLGSVDELHSKVGKWMKESGKAHDTQMDFLREVKKIATQSNREQLSAAVASNGKEVSEVREEVAQLRQEMGELKDMLAAVLAAVGGAE